MTIPLLSKITPELARWFWTQVEMSDGCWLWTGKRLTRGYGAFILAGKPVYAHRVSWVIANRAEVPEGHGVLHKCDTPKCVNPNHLFTGDQGVNLRDMFDKGRNNNSAHQVVSDADVTKLRKMYATGKYLQRELAEIFGVSRRQIGNLTFGRRGKRTEGPTVSFKQKVTAEDVTEMRKMHDTGETYVAIGLVFGISGSHASKLINNRQRKRNTERERSWKED